MTAAEWIVLVVLALVGVAVLVWLTARIVERVRSAVWRERPEEMSDRIAAGQYAGSATILALPGDIDGEIR